MRVLSWRLRQLALTWPTRPARVDDQGVLTWRQLDGAVAERIATLPDGPVLTTSQTARDAWIATLAGFRAGRGVVLASPTLGR